MKLTATPCSQNPLRARCDGVAKWYPRVSIAEVRDGDIQPSSFDRGEPLANLPSFKQAVRVATRYAPAPLLPVGTQDPGAPPSRRKVAALSHAEYVPTLTAAAALCVKAALDKAAW